MTWHRALTCFNLREINRWGRHEEGRRMGNSGEDLWEHASDQQTACLQRLMMRAEVKDTKLKIAFFDLGALVESQNLFHTPSLGQTHCHLTSPISIPPPPYSTMPNPPATLARWRPIPIPQPHNSDPSCRSTPLSTQITINLAAKCLVIHGCHEQINRWVPNPLEDTLNVGKTLGNFISWVSIFIFIFSNFQLILFSLFLRWPLLSYRYPLTSFLIIVWPFQSSLFIYHFRFLWIFFKSFISDFIPDFSTTFIGYTF